MSLILVLLAFLASPARAQSLPQLNAPVNDFAHVIDAQSAALLDTRIRALERATGDAVVVATVETFAPYGTIEEYAVKLYEQAGIGARSKDNGVLVVMALNERRVRIETGYGLEEFITDGFAGETIRQAMLPAFRSGNYGQGLLAGTTRVIQRIAERRGVTLSDIPQEQPQARGTPGISAGQIIFVIIVLIILSNMFRGRGGGSTLRRRGGWGGPWSGWGGGVGGFGGGGFGGGGFGGGFGGGGGGFGGFGGGRSGGGGASGGW